MLKQAWPNRISASEGSSAPRSCSASSKRPSLSADSSQAFSPPTAVSHGEFRGFPQASHNQLAVNKKNDISGSYTSATATHSLCLLLFSSQSPAFLDGEFFRGRPLKDMLHIILVMYLRATFGFLLNGPPVLRLARERYGLKSQDTPNRCPECGSEPRLGSMSPGTLV